MWEILSGRMKNRIIEFYGDVIKLDTPNLRLWAPIRDHKGILVIQYFFPFHTTGIFHNSSWNRTRGDSFLLILNGTDHPRYLWNEGVAVKLSAGQKKKIGRESNDPTCTRPRQCPRPCHIQEQVQPAALTRFQRRMVSRHVNFMTASASRCSPSMSVYERPMQT